MSFAFRAAALRSRLLPWVLLAAFLLAGLPQQARAAIAIESWQQASGAQVWLATSPALPMVDVQLDFDAGSRRDPADKVGLASAMARMSSKGVQARLGAPALDENELSDAWADIGASFSAGASDDRTSFHLRTLTEPELLQRALELAARQLGDPAWPEAVWQRERARWSAAIAEALTRPGPVAGRAFAQAVFGSHPYGAATTPESLARISVDDLRAHHEALILPCRARVSVVGAVTRAQADALVQQLLSRLPQDGSCPELDPVAPVQPLAEAAERRIPMASAQTHVLMGQPGYKRSDPDFFALLVGDYILGGGGFTSRLTEQVREQRGLSYSVYSHFAPGRDAGAFTVSLETRPDQADAALAVAREVVHDFVRDGPTQKEVQAAKDNLIGSFPLRLDSNRKLLGNVANIAWNDLPLDYLEHWTQRLDAVTADEIKAAFQRVLQPERMVTVVVGPVVPTPAPESARATQLEPAETGS